MGCLQDDLGRQEEALASLRRAVALDPKLFYCHFRIWLIRTRLGQGADATPELAAYLKTREGEPDHDWELCVGHFLAGDTTQPDFMAQAPKTVVRETDGPEHLCEAYYYSGMKRLLAGDKPGAADLFQKCIGTAQENFSEYTSAKAELKRLAQ
jgi:lipoprotein NlpI